MLNLARSSDSLGGWVDDGRGRGCWRGEGSSFSSRPRGLRPPPSRRTRPFASRSGDAKSFSPRRSSSAPRAEPAKPPQSRRGLTRFCLARRMEPAIPLIQNLAKRLMAHRYRFAVDHASGYTAGPKQGIPLTSTIRSFPDGPFRHKHSAFVAMCLCDGWGRESAVRAICSEMPEESGLRLTRGPASRRINICLERRRRRRRMTITTALS